MSATTTSTPMITGKLPAKGDCATKTLATIYAPMQSGWSNLEPLEMRRKSSRSTRTLVEEIKRDGMRHGTNFRGKENIPPLAFAGPEPSPKVAVHTVAPVPPLISTSAPTWLALPFPSLIIRLLPALHPAHAYAECPTEDEDLLPLTDPELSLGLCLAAHAARGAILLRPSILGPIRVLTREADEGMGEVCGVHIFIEQ